MSVKLWASEHGFDYLSLSKKTLEEAMNIMKNCFYKDESMCIAMELDKDPKAIEEQLELCMKAARDGVSIVAVENSTGKVVAAMFNELLLPTKPGELSYLQKFAADCKYQSSKALTQFLVDIEESCNFFEHFNIDCYMELEFLGTLPEYRCKGIGKKLIQVSIDLARELHSGKNVKVSINDQELDLEPVPKVLVGYPTSFITQRYAEDLGFKKVTEISYEKCVYKGKSFASRMGNHTPSLRVEALKL